MARLITGADYRDEDWFRRAGNLGMAGRMRRITACSVLLDSTECLSDGLYSELVVLLEALQGDDLRYADTYTTRETALKYLEEFGDHLGCLAGDFESVAAGLTGRPRGDQAPDAGS